ncbi:MAG: chitobiase/beta-hexosaminidase C-terminal domain-containing protein [Acidobacteriaceae bacterium]
MNSSSGLLNDLWEFNPVARKWTWMGGSSSIASNNDQPGVYGALGTPAVGNYPGARTGAVSWIDSGGNFWLLGGAGDDSDGRQGTLNDLWEFNPSTQEWAWMGGSNAVGRSGAYGVLGMPATGNYPGSRQGAVGWTDSTGNLWLFGGAGYDSAGVGGALNDLWEFNPASSEWIWMGGSSTIPSSCTDTGNCGQLGVYGSLGISTSLSVPGGRSGALSWTDIHGNLWLFGGIGIDSAGTSGNLNDLWEFSTSTSEWVWMGGSTTVPSYGTGQPGVYGTLGVPAAGNLPGGRNGAVSWTDGSGDLWLFGGQGYDSRSPGTEAYLNDLWEYQPVLLSLPADAPTFSVPAGTYTTVQTVTVSDATPGATIYYTTNGTIPTPSSTVYSGPITVSSTETVEAVATARGETISAVASAIYTITLPTATPTFNLASGTYNLATVALSDSTPGATIYYTTNGTTPTSNSNVYSGPIAVSSTETIEAIAMSSGIPNSAVSTATYTITATAPTTNEWEWIGGAGIGRQAAAYGMLGTPAAGNIPGGRAGAVSWTGHNGNFWLFGGDGFDSAGTSGALNDLWEFNPSTQEWAWMGGSSTIPSCTDTGNCGQPGVYGTLGTPAAGNIPGGRADAVSWTDHDGNLWLFGGEGLDSTDTFGALNDLWEFNPSISEWVWMGGSNTVPSKYLGQPGVYGTLDTPAAGNIPGGRYEAVAWIDNEGDLWLFGGVGYDSAGTVGELNDLWVLNPSTSEWTWMGGTSTVPAASNSQNIGGQPGVYGALGIPAVGNIPGGRSAAVSWTDHSGNLWLFGGDGFDSTDTVGELNDLWVFNSSTREWAWMGGSNAVPSRGAGHAGMYGLLGTPAVGNIPGGRYWPVGWTDSEGDLWLFGGVGYDSAGSVGELNDLWVFNPSTNEWTWMGGTSTFGSSTGVSGVYGTLGIPAAGNVPESLFSTVGWTDINGNFWLFGGSGNTSDLNDLWEYLAGLPVAAPAFSEPTGMYASTQTVTISDSTAGATIYYTTNGTVPTTSSTSYSGPITVSSSETLEAIATATGYTSSSIASASYTISIPTNPVPIISSMSPAFTAAGGGSFTMTITGSGFTTSSTIYWGISALATQYVSTTQLTAQVTANDIATAGTNEITVQTPVPGGGTSNSLAFEVDSAGSGATTAPTFGSLSASVIPGATASYAVTLPSTATNVTVTCLNLPGGAACSYSATTNAVTITTSTATPAGTYQVTLVFTETQPGPATGLVLLPILLLPLLYAGRKPGPGRLRLLTCLGVILIAAAASVLGCGGGGGSGSTPVTPTSSTHQVTSSGVVTLTIQ